MADGVIGGLLIEAFTSRIFCPPTAQMNDGRPLRLQCCAAAIVLLRCRQSGGTTISAAANAERGVATSLAIAAADQQSGNAATGMTDLRTTARAAPADSWCTVFETGGSVA